MPRKKAIQRATKGPSRFSIFSFLFIIAFCLCLLSLLFSASGSFDQETVIAKEVSMTETKIVHSVSENKKRKEKTQNVKKELQIDKKQIKQKNGNKK